MFARPQESLSPKSSPLETRPHNVRSMGRNGIVTGARELQRPGAAHLIVDSPPSGHRTPLAGSPSCAASTKERLAAAVVGRRRGHRQQLTAIAIIAANSLRAESERFDNVIQGRRSQIPTGRDRLAQEFSGILHFARLAKPAASHRPPEMGHGNR